MTLTLAAATGTKTFSETLMNSYSTALLAAYDWALGPVFPFEVGGNAWTGYILHTSNTLTYNLTRFSGTVAIVLNGVTVVSIVAGGLQSDTHDITDQGLTVGTVYTLSVTGDATVWWVGERKTINYTAPPTFANGTILTAANLNTLRAGILECDSALDWPLPPCPIEEVEETCHGSNDHVTVYRFTFFHVHDTLRYRYWHHAKGGHTVKTTIFLNDTNIYELAEKTPGHWVTGTIDIGPGGLNLGLTKGTIYYGYATVQLSGTTNDHYVQNKFWRLTEEISTACSPPPLWAHGGTNISAANLNKYGTIINSIHPGAASPTLPLYYEQPAVKTSGTHDLYLQHRRKWLRYVQKATGSNTVTIKYGPNLQTKADLPGGAGNLSFDLGGIPGLVPGQWYHVDDVEYAQEWTSSQP